MGLPKMDSDARRKHGPDLAPGTAVGDYRIDHTIGVGGMAVVYQATHPVIGKRVALKVLHRHLCNSEHTVSRFIQEARAVNQIGHPNIVDVFGCGTTEDGRAYLVMELLVGETLATRMKRTVPLVEACDVLVEVAYALEAAHEAGIVHRDLKPENIFLASRRGATSVKLVDFGIAKLTSGDEAGQVDPTRPGVLLGTPRYVSPEQVRGLPLDGRSDIYSLGVVAFELFTGRGLFTSDDPYEMFEKHAKLRAPPPSAFNPKLPARADELLGAMLEKDPAKRPTPAAVRDALIELRVTPEAPAQTRVEQPTEPIGHGTVRARGDESAVTSPMPRAGSASITRAVTPHPAVSRRWILPIGIGAIAIGVAAAIAFTGRDPAPAEVSQPAPPPAPASAVATEPDRAVPPPPPPDEVERDPADSANPAPKPPPTRPKRAAHAVEPKPPPATRPIDKSPAPVARPVDKPPSPPVAHPPEDDDAVRSPFERKP